MSGRRKRRGRPSKNNDAKMALINEEIQMTVSNDETRQGKRQKSISIIKDRDEMIGTGDFVKQSSPTLVKVDIPKSILKKKGQTSTDDGEREVVAEDIVKQEKINQNESTADNLIATSNCSIDPNCEESNNQQNSFISILKDKSPTNQLADNSIIGDSKRSSLLNKSPNVSIIKSNGPSSAASIVKIATTPTSLISQSLLKASPLGTISDADLSINSICTERDLSPKAICKRKKSYTPSSVKKLKNDPRTQLVMDGKTVTMARSLLVKPVSDLLKERKFKNVPRKYPMVATNQQYTITDDNEVIFVNNTEDTFKRIKQSLSNKTIPDNMVLVNKQDLIKLISCHNCAKLQNVDFDVFGNRNGRIINVSEEFKVGNKSSLGLDSFCSSDSLESYNADRDVLKTVRHRKTKQLLCDHCGQHFGTEKTFERHKQTHKIFLPKYLPGQLIAK